MAGKERSLPKAKETLLERMTLLEPLAVAVPVRAPDEPHRRTQPVKLPTKLVFIEREVCTGHDERSEWR